MAGEPTARERLRTLVHDHQLSKKTLILIAEAALDRRTDRRKLDDGDLNIVTATIETLVRGGLHSDGEIADAFARARSCGEQGLSRLRRDLLLAVHELSGDTLDLVIEATLPRISQDASLIGSAVCAINDAVKTLTLSGLHGDTAIAESILAAQGSDGDHWSADFWRERLALAGAAERRGAETESQATRSVSVRPSASPLVPVPPIPPQVPSEIDDGSGGTPSSRETDVD